MIEKILYIAIILVIIWFIYNNFIPTKGIQQITLAELKQQKMNKGQQLIDVRTKGEFAARHVKGFKNIPLHELSSRLDELSKDKEIVVICQSGMRSNKACKLLKKKGFIHIINIKGGMMNG